ncbi:MAG: hypothetical protein H6R04_1323 [Burkholderiaceae bacterium]|nr:hypothetical protein [Burkholderiaceae bacterium]
MRLVAIDASPLCQTNPSFSKMAGYGRKISLGHNFAGALKILLPVYFEPKMPLTALV